MNWKSFFYTGPNMTAEEVRNYVETHQSGSYQLLDVRQPGEYDQHHLPGAILIPLKELADRIGELDSRSPTLVYCHSGVRSKSACQLLSGQGFEEVYNMSGGIKSWNGIKLSGPETKGIEFFISGEFPNIFQMAYQMENGLKQFYLALSQKVVPQEQKNLLTRLARYEDGHMAKLLHQYQENSMPEAPENSDIMEGGFHKKQILAAYANQIKSIEDMIYLSMMFETQAFDLYSRLAKKTTNQKLQQFYQLMAEEEQMHLVQLSRELDKLVNGK